MLNTYGPVTGDDQNVRLLDVLGGAQDCWWQDFDRRRPECVQPSSGGVEYNLCSLILETQDLRGCLCVCPHNVDRLLMQLQYPLPFYNLASRMGTSEQF